MNTDWIFYAVSAQCVMTAVFLIWLSRWEKARERREKAREEERKRQEETREKSDAFIANGVFTAIALGEAIAISVKHLDAECNGEMDKALEYAKAAKTEHRDFLVRQGIRNLQN